MTALSAHDFDTFFRAVHGHGPFPWQRRLCRRVLDIGWPRVLQLPTASGKTAVMDVAVFALAAGAPAARRRIAFVVDRRVVVDEASERAWHLAATLAEARAGDGVVGAVAAALRAQSGGGTPLVTATLRGGIFRDDAWARTPAQPVLVCSTVDQVGSRLLFRGYGCGSARSWPIHAGLLGIDTLLVVDEAHCATPFCETALAIAERYGRWAEVELGKPLTLLRMSATLGEAADFGLEEEDRRDERLAVRLRAAKPARLEPVQAGKGREPRQALAERIVRIACDLAEEKPRVVGVVVNRVATARAVFAAIPLPEARKLLLTGRVRGWERDRLLADWKAILAAHEGRPATAESKVVVATQCIEVGANLDFDALVTECAPLDALRQRFGRLNRLGRLPAAPAAIVVDAGQVADGSDDDPVYEAALRETWRWLQDMAATGNGPAVDFGVQAMEAAMAEADDLERLCTPVKHAPVLLPTHVDLLVQTSPEPAVSPAPSLFLHGPRTGADDVAIVWRADLAPERPEDWPDIVAVVPPLAGEGCPVPFVAGRAWLARQEAAPAADADVPAAVTLEDDGARQSRVALRWRGLDDAQVIDSSELRPGDTVIVPSSYGGCDAYGWNPTSTDPVLDVADAVAARARRRPVLRLHDAVVRTWLRPGSDGDCRVAEGLAALRAWVVGEEEVDAAAQLVALADADELPAWLRDLCRGLARDGRRRRVLARDCLAIVGSRPLDPVGDEAESDFSTSDDRSSLTVRVTLERHSDGVRRMATAFARACALPEAVARDVALAAWLHDVGKADPRFQVWLCDGDEIGAALLAEPLAKSDANPRNRAALRRARRRAHYPEGARHEFQSLALIEACPALVAEATDAELVRYLVSSHHGHGRPFAPVVEDPDPCEVTLVHGGLAAAAPSDHRLHRLDSGQADRFWRLVRRFGWWGLAFLEAVLRLADHRCSEDEQREGA